MYIRTYVRTRHKVVGNEVSQCPFAIFVQNGNITEWELYFGVYLIWKKYILCIPLPVELFFRPDWTAGPQLSDLSPPACLTAPWWSWSCHSSDSCSFGPSFAAGWAASCACCCPSEFSSGWGGRRYVRLRWVWEHQVVVVHTNYSWCIHLFEWETMHICCTCKLLYGGSKSRWHVHRLGQRWQ